MPNSQQNTEQDLNMYPQTQQMVADDEIDLLELFFVIWAGKWKIILITMVFAVGSTLFALSKPNIYTSSVLLAPATSDSGGGMGALASQFGG